MPDRIEFMRGSIKETRATAVFERTILEAEDLSGVVIYGYPLSRSHAGGPTSPDALYLAPNGHVTIIHMVSGTKLPESYMAIQDDMFLAVDGKLRASPKIRNGR